MLPKEKRVMWQDHRNIGVQVDPGGTRRIFEMELAGSDSYRRRVRVGSSIERVVEIEQLFSPESWFEVSFDNGASISYDRDGFLQKMTIPVAGFINSLSQMTQDEMDPGFLLGIESLLESDSEISIEADMRGGIAEKDSKGWVSVVCTDRIEAASEGAFGIEIEPNMKEPDVFTVKLVDINDLFLGRLYCIVYDSDGMLSIALGDGEHMISSTYYLQIDPSGVLKIRTPEGATEFLGTLKPSNDEI